VAFEPVQEAVAPALSDLDMAYKMGMIVPPIGVGIVSNMVRARERCVRQQLFKPQLLGHHHPVHVFDQDARAHGYAGGGELSHLAHG